MLIRKKLTADEFSNPALRYDEGCDCIQFTPDNGETWVDQPANDPRSSDAYRLPPVTGTDIRCRAAEGMTRLIRAFVDARLDFIGQLGIAGAILGIVTFIPGFNVLYALILAFVGFAVTIAAEVLEAAFTEPVYDQIRCIFECVIDADGQMDQNAFDAAYADLIALDAIARTWCQHVMTLMGPVGMSNAGVQFKAAADCDCNCCDDAATITFDVAGCYTLLARTGFAITTLDNAQGNPAPSAKSGNKTSGFGHAVKVRVEVGAVLTSASMQIRWNSASNPTNVYLREITMYSPTNTILAQFSSAAAGFTQNTWHTVTVNYAGSTECAYLICEGAVEGTGQSGQGNIDNIAMTKA